MLKCNKTFGFYDQNTVSTAHKNDVDKINENETHTDDEAKKMLFDMTGGIIMCYSMLLSFISVVAFDRVVFRIVWYDDSTRINYNNKKHVNDTYLIRSGELYIFRIYSEFYLSPLQCEAPVLYGYIDICKIFHIAWQIGENGTR